MKKFILLAVLTGVIGAFSVTSLQAQCCSGTAAPAKDKKAEATKEAPRKS